MSHLSVLVIDDEEDLRFLLREELEERDYAVAEACNGLEALKKISTTRYDAIVTDLSMPELDGVQLATYAKVSMLNHKTPIFVVTAHSDPTDVRLSRLANVAGVLPKPVNIDNLVKALGTSVDPFLGGFTYNPEMVKDLSKISDAVVTSYAFGFDVQVEDTFVSSQQGAQGELIALIPVFGRICFGEVIVSTSYDCTSALARNLYGLEGDSVELSIMHDIVGELANQLAGAWKNSLHKEDVFVNIGLPNIQAGGLGAHNFLGTPKCVLPYQIGQHQLWVEVRLGRNIHQHFPEENKDFSPFINVHKKAS